MRSRITATLGLILAILFSVSAPAGMVPALSLSADRVPGPESAAVRGCTPNRRPDLHRDPRRQRFPHPESRIPNPASRTSHPASRIPYPPPTRKEGYASERVTICSRERAVLHAREENRENRR